MRVGPVAQFIQRFRGKNQAPFIDWVGTSMGGLIGMMLASKPNSPIRRLVLNDVGPFISWQALARLKNMHVGKAARFSDLDEAERHLRAACADFGPLSEEQWSPGAPGDDRQRGPGRGAKEGTARVREQRCPEPIPRLRSDQRLLRDAREALPPRPPRR